MKLKRLLLILIACAVFGLIYVSRDFLAVLYYRKPSYTIGTKNSTTEILRNVVTKLLPTGQDPCGILDPGQEKRYMDPKWPVPETIYVTFEDATATKHELFLDTKLPNNFHGDITLVIIQTNGVFNIRLEH